MKLYCATLCAFLIVIVSGQEQYAAADNKNNVAKQAAVPAQRK